MCGSYRRLKCLAFTLSFAGGLSGPAALAADHQTPESRARSQASGQISKSMVRQVQRELKNRGFYDGNIDGINGSQTRMAVQKFQRSENIVESGTLNDATLKSLGVESAVRQSQGEASRSAGESEAGTSSEIASSEMVRAAQRQLKRDGYYQGEVDGVMGQETRDALRQYQQEQHLAATGRLTNETARSLGIQR